MENKNGLVRERKGDAMKEEEMFGWARTRGSGVKEERKEKRSAVGSRRP